MKRATWVTLAVLGWLSTGCATRPPVAVDQPSVVEVACGECLFGLPGDGCDLAVRIAGKAWYVDGVELDALGDAHAEDGMCRVIRHARVTGRVRRGRFVASSLQLLSAGGERPGR